MLSAHFRHDLPQIIQGLQKSYRILHRHDGSMRRSQRNHIIVSFTNGASPLSTAIDDEVTKHAFRDAPLRIAFSPTAILQPNDTTTHIQLDVEDKNASQAFHQSMREFIPNSTSNDHALFYRGTEEHNVIGHVDRVQNVLIDMRAGDSASPSHADAKWSYLSRACLNLSKAFWDPKTVVLCAAWDGADARELLNHCRYKFHRVFYLVQDFTGGDTSKLLLLHKAATGTPDDLTAAETERYLGFPAFLVCQYPTDGVLHVADRRATRRHPTGREHRDLLPVRRPKWMHQGLKIPARMRPASFTESRPPLGDLDGGAQKARIRYQERQRFNAYSRTILQEARKPSVFRSGK